MSRQHPLRLPSGTVTFLFTDIEGSTRLWEQNPALMERRLTDHDRLIRAISRRNGGHVFKTVGDAFCVAFTRADAALKAAADIQRELLGAPGAAELKVRIAAHTGSAQERDGDYFGPALNRVARLVAAAHGGQILASRSTQELAGDARPPGTRLTDLGEHRLKDLTEPEHIFQLSVDGLRDRFPPLDTLDAVLTNLPVQLTSFVGRDREMREITSLLRDPWVRLLTLTGPGGAGKTRLAIQSAAEVIGEFEDGVFMVDLAPLTEPRQVPGAVCSALGLEEGERDALETSLEWLSQKRALLLTDNFEHLLGAAPVLTTLLTGAPRLSLLITSRSALGVSGERVYQVAPLATPEPRDGLTPDQAMKSEAVALFVARAQAAQAGFELTDSNSRPVAEICSNLDGLPLALELAAARLSMFTPQDLLRRLRSATGPLRMLSGRPGAVTARHLTLEIAIDWSYRLLSISGQTLLGRLSLFRGGWSYDAAEGVCGRQDLDVFTAMEELVEASMVRVHKAAAETRYAMLETIREFAAGRLSHPGDTEPAAQAHAHYFLEAAETVAPDLMGGGRQEEALAFFDREHDNLRAALAFLIGAEGGSRAARLALACARFWRMRGQLTEGRRWLGATLEASPPDVELRPRLLYRAGSMASAQSDYIEGRRLLDQALALSRDVGDEETVADSLNGLGAVELASGDADAAAACFRQSLQISRKLGDDWGASACLMNLGNIACEQGDYASARQMFEDSLHLWRAQDEIWGTAFCLACLGRLALDRGEFEKAVLLSTESLDLRRQMGDRAGAAYVLGVLGAAKAQLGDMGGALELLAESLEESRSIGHTEQICSCLRDLGIVSAHQRDPETAARLWGAAQALAARENLSLDRAERERLDRELAAAKSLTSEERWTAAWVAGEAMSLDRAMDYADQRLLRRAL